MRIVAWIVLAVAAVCSMVVVRDALEIADAIRRLS
jgi:hypothetical protein